MMNARTVVAACGLMTAALVMPAAAQSSATRWTPWVGCWDVVRDSAPQPAGDVAVSAEPEARAGVCVSPAGPEAVTMVTTVEGQAALTETVTADGLEHPLGDRTCTGSRRAAWSSDGRRLFTQAIVTCPTQARQTMTGVALIMPDGTWLDVLAVRRDADEHIRVRKYRRASGRAGSGVVARGAPWTLDAIAEASRHVPLGVLEASLIETRAGFSLTSRSVTQLAEAGVPSSLIDLVVALSYPDEFVVERASRPGGRAAVLQRDGTANRFPGRAPAYYAPFGYFFDDIAYPFSYYSPYYYSNYDYLPIYGDGGGGSGVTEPQPSGSGRVVNGLGYTRVRPREAAPVATPSSRGGSTAQRSPSSGSGDGSATPASQGGTQGGSSEGDSGRTGTGSGRTAQPR